MSRASAVLITPTGTGDGYQWHRGRAAVERRTSTPCRICRTRMPRACWLELNGVCVPCRRAAPGRDHASWPACQSTRPAQVVPLVRGWTSGPRLGVAVSDLRPRAGISKLTLDC